MAGEPDMTTKLDVLQMTVDGLDQTVERLDDAIRGNGGDGLLTQAAVMERRMETCEEFVAEFKATRRWLSLGILALFGSLAWRVVEWYLTQVTV